VNNKKSPVLVVGSIAFDTIHAPSGTAECVLGGSVNFFSVAASLFSPVQVVGVVGEDYPKKHLEYLASRSIDINGISVQKGKTFHWRGSYEKNLNEAETLSTCLNVFENFNPVLSEEQAAAEYVFLANIDPVLQLRVLDQVKNPRLVACDTMNFWIRGKREELLRTLKRVDVLCVNEGEAYLLADQGSGARSITQAAEVIRKMGPKILVIKRGEYGANLYTDAGIFVAPAHPVRTVIDPTGAGDSFAGAFMGYLAKAGADRKMADEDLPQWDSLLRNAVVTGCVLSSFTVEDFSLHRLMKLEYAELMERRKAHIAMMAI